MNGVDLDLQLFQGMIHDSVNYCNMHNEPLQFQYSNGKHGFHLIKLPMSKGNDGRVTPNINKCVDEMLSVVLENVREDANDIVVDLLLTSSSREEKRHVLRFASPLSQKKLKLFVRSWKSGRIWMSWMNSQSWKRNYSGLLWQDSPSRLLNSLMSSDVITR